MIKASSGVKRARTDDSLASTRPPRVPETFLPSSHTPSAASATFRNVSACNRCRLRKHRCDQNLPACSACEKAGVKCVGFDPVTKRETPRTYVYYLENRVSYLETLLEDNGIPFAPSQVFDLGAKPSSEQLQGQPPSQPLGAKNFELAGRDRNGLDALGRLRDLWGKGQGDERKLNRLVSNIGMVSVEGTSDPHFLGPTSGISFARVVFAAINSSVPTASSRTRSRRPPKLAAPANKASVRDSFFGLQSKPAVEPAPFPDQALGLQLVTLYFEHANPQIPILHKGEFMALFHRAYASTGCRRSARELYMLNIVFAIGAGIILEDSRSPHSSGSSYTEPMSPGSPDPRKHYPSTKRHQPEEYHASAMMHLESFLSSMPAADEPDRFSGGLEELQAVLLLAGFALLRPVGLWYISGIATRLAVDLGLHHEDGTDLDEGGALDHLRGHGMSKAPLNELADVALHDVDAKEKGRREWLRDLRRRLWWCVYAFDRLVSTCVGRPFGITDQVITTDFPTVLKDEDITPSGFAIPAESFSGPSYKRVSHHYFRLRLLQSEILQVLQYRQAQEVHSSSTKQRNGYMHTRLSSSFLQPFESFHAWRQDMDRRLWDWKESTPRQEDTTVQFSVQFLELNYWQAIIMLYRQGLNGVPGHTGRTSPSAELSSPSPIYSTEDAEDENVYLKVAEASWRTLILYRQLHRIHLVNYTYLATVHLFMAGIAFLYVLWHSPTVRCRLTLDDVDFTVLAATSVLGDLIDKCPPAEACRDAFERMSRATIKLCLSTTGFGSKATGFWARENPQNQESSPAVDDAWFQTKQQKPQRSSTQFDMRPEDDASDEMHKDQGTFGSSYGQWQPAIQPTMAPQPQTFRTLSDGSRSERQFDDSAPMEQMLPSDARTLASNDTLYGPYDFSANNGLDALSAGNDTTVFDGQFGMNLGFGETHDWSDGVELDLFDGFFFGGTNNGG